MPRFVIFICQDNFCFVLISFVYLTDHICIVLNSWMLLPCHFFSYVRRSSLHYCLIYFSVELALTGFGDFFFSILLCPYTHILDWNNVELIFSQLRSPLRSHVFEPSTIIYICLDIFLWLLYVFVQFDLSMVFDFDSSSIASLFFYI